MGKNTNKNTRSIIRSQTFNLDNGSGTTVDEVLFDAGPISWHILRVYAVYQEASQTVAAGNFKLGTAVGGATLVAATAYTNDAAVGDVTAAAVLLNGYIPANEELFLRHTGIAATATGTATIVIELTPDE